VTGAKMIMLELSMGWQTNWEREEMSESSDYEGKGCKEPRLGDCEPQLLEKFQRSA
jgi:hypothetical protein